MATESFGDVLRGSLNVVADFAMQCEDPALADDLVHLLRLVLHELPGSREVIEDIDQRDLGDVVGRLCLILHDLGEDAVERAVFELGLIRLCV